MQLYRQTLMLLIIQLRLIVSLMNYTNSIVTEQLMQAVNNSMKLDRLNKVSYLPNIFLMCSAPTMYTSNQPQLP